MSFLTNYLKFKKIELEQLTSYRPTRIFFAKCKKKRLAIYRLIHSLRARFTEYIAYTPFNNLANKIQIKQQLAIKYGLNIKKKKKSIMKVEDKFKLLNIVSLD